MKHLVELLEDFIRSYFDKILLCGLFAGLVWIGARSTEEAVKEWAMGQANTVIGAIIMLTTGAIIGRSKNGNGNGGHDGVIQPTHQSGSISGTVANNEPQKG
mgnify:CR=1 FL=1